MTISTVLDSELAASQRVLLVGPPGCGKTALVHQAFARASIPLTVWRASLMERVDVSGCIVPDIGAGVSRQLPFSDVAELRQGKGRAGLFIDDLGQAPLDVQAGLMRLFEREVFDPEKVVIWAATNRPADRAGVSSLCEPLRSRFDSAYAVPVPGTEDSPSGATLLGDWPAMLDSWVDWAFDHGAGAEIVAWHRSTNGKSLYAWKPSADPSVRMADFRTWGSMIPRWQSGLRSLAQVSAVLGKATAAEFLAFASLADQLPSPDQVWLDPLGAPVPTEPSAQWLIACSLAALVTPSTAGAFVSYAERLGRVMCAFGARTAYKRLGAKLSGCREWGRWFGENKTLFECGSRS